MRFTFTSAFVAAIALALHANAQSIIGFSGDSCNGSQGDSVACNGACIDFSGRHSFEVFGSAANVVLFAGGGCSGESFNFGTEQPNNCINVNTGTAINSFQCT
ncbi:hypothetical protein R3P38DRAFT_2515114 [Favolaschia claudopus]|uniref:Uncharacterized protein n=1 Tax=Favolaschia claudopus TaxID=2862362 RepID=A0AAW0CJS6_9AGAR